jgi:hypothetical protein
MVHPWVQERTIEVGSIVRMKEEWITKTDSKWLPAYIRKYSNRFTVIEVTPYANPKRVYLKFHEIQIHYSDNHSYYDYMFELIQ